MIYHTYFSSFVYFSLKKKKVEKFIQKNDRFEKYKFSIIVIRKKYVYENFIEVIGKKYLYRIGNYFITAFGKFDFLFL